MNCKVQKVYVADLLVCDCGVINHKPVSLGSGEYLTYFKGSINREISFKIQNNNSEGGLSYILTTLSNYTNQEPIEVKHILRLIITDYNNRHYGNIINYGSCSK